MRIQYGQHRSEFRRLFLRTGFLAITSLALVSRVQAQTTWNTTTTGTWGNSAFWSPATVPNGVGVQVEFPSIITAGRTVYVDQNFTVGTLVFSSTQAYTLQRTGTGGSLILEDSDGTANIWIAGSGTTGVNWYLPTRLNSNLLISSTAVGVPSTTGGFAFGGVLSSTSARTITIDQSVGYTGGSRNGIPVVFATDYLAAGSTIQLRGTTNRNGNAFIEPTGIYGSHVTFDIDTATYIRPTGVIIRGPINFGTATSATTSFSANQGNGGNSNTHLVGALTGGGASHVLSFESAIAQVSLENQNGDSTYQGTIRLNMSTTANGSPLLWFGRDDQLGNSANHVQFLGGGGPTFGGLGVTADVTTQRTFDVGTGSSASAMAVMVPEGTTLTLDGTAQITRSAGSTVTTNAFVKNGAGTLVLKGSAAFDSGDYFRANGNAVAGTLRLDNSVTNVNDRLGATNATGRLLLADGRMEFVGGTSAPQSETIKRDLRPIVGGNDILVANGTGQTSTVTFQSLTRVTGQRSQYGTLNIAALPNSADALGSANNKVLFTTNPTLSNGIIGAWARVGDDWATYDATNGVQAYTGYVALASAVATDNAVLASGTTLSGPASVNTLKLTSNGATVDLNGNALTLAAGGLLNTGTNSVSNGSFSAGAQMIVTDNGSLTIAAPITSTAFIKTGLGRTILSATNTQNYTVVNEGTLAVSDDSQLGSPMTYTATPSGYLVLAGGKLEFTSSMSSNRAIVLGASGTTGADALSASPLSRNEISVAENQVASISGKVTGGPGPGLPALIKTGKGTLFLSNTATVGSYGLYSAVSGTTPNDFLGNLVIQEGAVRISNAAQLGINSVNGAGADTNDVVFRGGILELSGIGYAVGGNVNSRAFYVENGGGGIRAINLAATQTFSTSGGESLVYRGTNPGTFEILEDAASNGANVLNVTYGASNLTSNSGPGSGELTWRATGTSSNYRGTTTLNIGTLVISANAPHGAPGALGSGTTDVSVGAATSSLAAGAKVGVLIDTAGVTVGRNFTVNDGNVEALGAETFIGGTHASGTSVYSGTFTMNRGITLTAAAGGQVDFTGRLTDGALTKSVTKAGAGIVNLTGSNTYDGGTIVAAGVLKVNNSAGSATGSGAVSVLAGATLAGSGSIQGATTISGTVSPGDSVGTLSIGNNVTFATGGVFKVELDGAGNTADVLAIGGNLDLSNADSLTVSLLNSAPTSNLIIATYTGTLTGTFDSVFGGYTLDYGVLNANAITLVVPEPSAFLMLAGGVGLLTLIRRRRV